MAALDSRRHYWSSQIGATLPTEWTPSKAKPKESRDQTDKGYLEGIGLILRRKHVEVDSPGFAF